MDSAGVLKSDLPALLTLAAQALLPVRFSFRRFLPPCLLLRASYYSVEYTTATNKSAFTKPAPHS